MRCLFAVSSWFVQRASLTVNIDLSDVINRYYTVLYRTVVVYEKKNRSLVFSGSRKIPTLGSTIQWETRQASFPTGTVGPRVGIFLSPLNTNDGFYLSYMTTWLLSYMGGAKYFLLRKRVFKGPIYCAKVSQRHQAMVSVTYWRHITLMTSWNVHRVTKPVMWR